MKKILMSVGALLVVICGFPVQAHADLILRGTDSLGNQLIYDDDLNVTWYDFANLRVSWQEALDWASNLSVTFGGTQYTDWRLPTTLQPDASCSGQYNPNERFGFNCSGSELGHLYYSELGNPASGPLDQSFIDGATGQTESFQDLAEIFWSSTESSTFPGFAWEFNFTTGEQVVFDKNSTLVDAIAVRAGDVTSVPEPATLLLFGSGLSGLAFIRGRARGRKP